MHVVPWNDIGTLVCLVDKISGFSSCSIFCHYTKPLLCNGWHQGVCVTLILSISVPIDNHLSQFRYLIRIEICLSVVYGTLEWTLLGMLMILGFLRVPPNFYLFLLSSDFARHILNLISLVPFYCSLYLGCSMPFVLLLTQPRMQHGIYFAARSIWNIIQHSFCHLLHL